MFLPGPQSIHVGQIDRLRDAYRGFRRVSESPVTLVHQIEGDGEPLLLLNGVFMTAASWAAGRAAAFGGLPPRAL